MPQALSGSKMVIICHLRQTRTPSYHTLSTDTKKKLTSTTQEARTNPGPSPEDPLDTRPKLGVFGKDIAKPASHLVLPCPWENVKCHWEKDNKIYPPPYCINTRHKPSAAGTVAEILLHRTHSSPARGYRVGGQETCLGSRPDLAKTICHRGMGRNA